MRQIVLVGLFAIAVSQTLQAASFEADSKRGAALFREQDVYKLPPGGR